MWSSDFTSVLNITLSTVTATNLTVNRNYSSNIVTVSWNLSTQNLTIFNPPIVYCLEVYNITCGDMDLIFSHCNITNTSYTSSVLSPYYVYKTVIMPKNNTDLARNGTQAMITGILFSYNYVAILLKFD